MQTNQHNDEKRVNVRLQILVSITAVEPTASAKIAIFIVLLASVEYHLVILNGTRY